MSETDRHRSALRGHRVDAIHAHEESRLKALLPWLIVAVLAVAILGWLLTRSS